MESNGSVLSIDKNQKERRERERDTYPKHAIAFGWFGSAEMLNWNQKIGGKQNEQRQRRGDIEKEFMREK